MRFDLTDLRVFLHACEAGSMTGAADRASLTLAAVRARIRALETRAGAPLLLRHARGVAPTAAGQALARHARALLHQIDTLRRDFAPQPPAGPPPLRLLANSAALLRPLHQAIAEACAALPDARILVRESGSEVTVHALHAGAAELGIVSDAVDTGDLACEPLGADPLVLVTAPDHPLAGCAAVGFAEALRHPWIGWTEDGALQLHLNVQAQRLGATLRIRASVPSVAGVLALAGRGVGVAVLPAVALGGGAGVDASGGGGGGGAGARARAEADADTEAAAKAGIDAGANADAAPTLVITDGIPVAVRRLPESWARRRLLLCRSGTAQRADAARLAGALHALWQAPPPQDRSVPIC